MNHIASFFLLNRVSCRDMSRSLATVVRLSIMEAAASINLTNVLMSLSVNVFIQLEKASPSLTAERGGGKNQIVIQKTKLKKH